MRSLGSLIVACLMAMFASGCSTLYEVGYCWTLDGHEEGDPLAQQARDLKFRFHPTPAGVAFSLQNTGESDATIDWTQSYFLAPDGTSTPPLRTETLVVAGNKPQDAAPKSIIPRGATLKRFVALDSRAGKGLGMGAFAIRKEISRRTTKWSAEGGWTWSA
ncbi:MAG: hypothetical protein RL112_1250, partial [Planctomycetota bacterium]